MKRWIVVAGIAVVAVLFFLIPRGQRADRSFDASVARPAYTARHPRLLLDEAHYNVHTIGSTYAPFAKLMANDGYDVEPNRQRFTADSLRGADVLVISNAAGGSNPKLFGLNLVPLRRGDRKGPAFTAAEIAAVRDWVARGGSLLLIADHHPFGGSAAGLAAAFGVTMNGGTAEVPSQHRRDTIEFTRANGLLADHEITAGVDRVLSFTGQSLTAPASMTILRLPADTLDALPPTGRTIQPGNAQLVAFDYGKGRVAVAGEAAMWTAQIDDRGRPFGMNVAGCDNRRLTLNLMHWLTRASAATSR